MSSIQRPAGSASAQAAREAIEQAQTAEKAAQLPPDAASAAAPSAALGRAEAAAAAKTNASPTDPDQIDASARLQRALEGLALEPPSLPPDPTTRARPDAELTQSALASLAALSETLLKASTVTGIIAHADDMKKNPERSLVLTALATPEAKAALGDVLGELSAADAKAWTALQAEALAHCPTDAVLLLDGLRGQAQSQLKTWFPGGDVLGAMSQLDEPSFALTGNWLQSFGGNAALAVGAETVTDASPLMAALTGAADAPAFDSTRAFIDTLLLGEASFEFLVGMAGKELTGDHQEHLALLQRSLEGLKKQKEALIKRLGESDGKIIGMQLSQARSAKKSERLGDLMTMLSFAGACVAIAVAVVAVVVAIVIAVCSVGWGTGVSALIICCAVAMIIGAVGTLAVTIVMNLSTLMRGLVVIFKYLGLKDAELQMSKWHETWHDNVASKEWFMIACVVAMLGFGALSLAGGLGMGFVCTGMTVGATGATTASKLITCTNVCSSLVTMGSGAWTIGSSIATYAVTTELVKEQLKQAAIKAELGRLSLRLADLMLEIKRLENIGDAEQDRLRDAEERQQAIMKNLQLCAAAVTDIRRAVTAEL